MSLDDLRPALADVARDGDVGKLLDVVRGDHDVYDVAGQAREWSEGSEVDDLRDELKDAENARNEAIEKLEAEERAHDETKSELQEQIDDLKGENDALEEEIREIRNAQNNGEPLPPPRPPPSPVNVGLVVAQKMADLLTEIGKRYQQAALKAGRRTAAGKAASALAFELLSAAEVERAKIPR